MTTAYIKRMRDIKQLSIRHLKYITFIQNEKIKNLYSNINRSKKREEKEEKKMYIPFTTIKTISQDIENENVFCF